MHIYAYYYVIVITRAQGMYGIFIALKHEGVSPEG